MYVGANGQVGLQAAVQEARSCTGLNIISYHIISYHNKTGINFMIFILIFTENCL